MHTFVLLIFFVGAPYQPEIYPIQYPSAQACYAASHSMHPLPGDPNKGRLIRFTQCAGFPATYSPADIKYAVDQQLAAKARADCNMLGMQAGFDQTDVMQACTAAVGSNL